MTGAKKNEDKQPLVHGTDESQKIASKEDEQGFRGVKVDPLPNSAHSLESGPDAPTVAEMAAAMKEA
jgi:hypothetical protein